MAANDPSFGSVVLLLPMADTGLSDVKGHAITKNGNVARSATQSKWGGYSAVFDGSGDYLSLAAGADFAFTTEPFTIEAWVYIAGNSPAAGSGYRYATIFSELSASAGGVALSIAGSASTTGTGLLWEDKSTGASITGAATATLNQNEWHHIALCRSGDTMYLGLNGTVYPTSITGGASRTIGSSTYAAWIGRQNVASYNYDFNGYIDDLRITKGVARYTANYTPPVAPHPLYGRYVGGSLTEDSQHTDFRVRVHRLDSGAMLNELVASGSSYEIPCCPVVAPYTDYSGPVMIACFPRMSGVWAANTVKSVGDYCIPTDPVTTPYVFRVSAVDAQPALLMHMDGANDGTVFTDLCGHTMTRTGNTVTKTATKKFGTASAYFDGSGDYLSFTTGSEFDFGIDDFTIEAWINIDAGSAGSRNILTKFTTWATDVDFVFEVSSSGKLSFIAGDAVPLSLSSNDVLATGQWIHAAVTRAQGVTRIFVDGIAQAATHTGSVTIPNGKTTATVGANGYAANYWKGYLDELRVTKGFARYTVDFTPPSAPFPYGTGLTEPEWPTTPGGTVNDGDLTWTCVDRMLQPILHGPLIPSI